MLLLSALVCPITSLAGEPAELRVMSFNIRYGTAKDGDNVWGNRRDLVVDTIRAFDPDLLGTQETLPFQADYLMAKLPGYTKIGWSRDASENGEQCAIFVRTDRFQVAESGQFWLSENPDKKYSKSWDSSLPRVLTWVILRDKQDPGDEFVFANTHFDHRGKKARIESAHLIQRRAAELSGTPVILTGDFNCPERSEPWQAITASNLLRDTYRVAHSRNIDDEGTFNGFAGRTKGARIDWVMVTEDFKVESAAIDRTNREGRYPSDHFPVTTVLTRD